MRATRPGSELMAQGNLPVNRAEPRAYLFNIVEGPTHRPEEYLPALRLLAQRFAGELWTYGVFEADLEVDRMRLRVVKNPYRNRFRNFLHFARLVWRRARELRRLRPPNPVVVSYDPFKGGLLAWRVARLLRAAFVCEVNGVYGDPDNLSNVSSRPWRWARQRLMRLLGAFVLHRADGVRLLFDGQLARFATVRRNTVVRHFFALSYTEHFQPAPEEPIVLSVGFPFERKGMDVLVRAFTRLAPKFPQWKLQLIGHEVQQSLRQWGMEHPQIEALPGMPQVEMAPRMSRCAIFALASRSEAMGRVLVEAAAAGKPRIATRVGGVHTVIEAGYDGLLVAKNDVEGLAAGLDALMGDAQLRQRFGEAARRRTEQEFSGSTYLHVFEDLIATTLAAAGGAAPAGAPATR
jgi:glycosyltransferase involved in cell wall biosynthesis